MSSPHESRFFGFQVPSGQPFHGNLNEAQRPDIIRRIECHYCPQLVTFHWPTDEEGNVLPKHCCRLLDLENAKIQEENTKRHPTEQLPFFDCIFGPISEIPIPSFPRNASDIIPRG